MSDILFHKDHFVFSYRVSGILVRDNKVLLQAPKGTGEYAFPGGHVALGETNAETLAREWREETGADIEVLELKWVEENFFPWGDKACHQICLSYLVLLRDPDQIPLDGSFMSREAREDDKNAIFFHWVPLREVKNLTEYPTKAAELLLSPDEGVKHIVYRE
jgi:ADP-ribose pyrophosphatase YjhB (NUDIX family)